MKISKRTVEDLVASKRDEFHWDDTLKGFGIKVTPKGRKVFVLQTRLRGRSKRFTIGVFGQPWSPDQARDEALRILGQTVSGIDPTDKRKAAGADITVADICKRYFENGCAHKKKQTVDFEKGLAKRHIVPLIGKQHLMAVTAGTVQKLQKDIADGKTAVREKTGWRGTANVKGGKGAANRTIALLSSILSFAVQTGVVAENVALGTKQFKLRTRSRYLSVEELQRLGKVLNDPGNEAINPYALAALRFLLLAGCRRNEAATLEWKWVDLDKSLVLLPDSKTGARVLVLGASAVDLLKRIPRIAGSRFVFPSTRGDGPVVGLSKVWSTIRNKAHLQDVRLHDLRHSFASAAVSSGESLYIVGKLLGHTQAGTTQRYAHVAQDPIRATADKVSANIERSLSGVSDD